MNTVSPEGEYFEGEKILVYIEFTENVFVIPESGSPSLLINDSPSARYANYLSGSGTKRLYFEHTVVDSIYIHELSSSHPYSIELNGSLISDAAGNPAYLGVVAKLNQGDGTCSLTAKDDAPLVEGVTLVAGAIDDDPDGAATINAYQWYKDNVLIDGATSSTYSTPSTSAGVYKVAITYDDAQGFRETVESPEQVVAKVIQTASGSSSGDVMDLARLDSWSGPDSAFIDGVPTDEATAVAIYAQPGAGADLITFDSLGDAHKHPGSAERAVFLSNDLDLSNIDSALIPDDQRYGTTSDGTYEPGFIAAYSFFGQYTTDISFGISGMNKFTDVIADAVTGGSSADGTLDLYLTNGSNGDAFFLHDAFSDYHKDVETKKDAFGRDYAARIANINSIHAGDADDIIDLTTTESIGEISGGGVKNVFAGKGDDIVIGSHVQVFGEDGNDTLISHHGTVMSGGAGEDLFGFLATPGMQDLTNGFLSEPIHRIQDFETGVDSIKFYVSSDLESTGSMQTGNRDHITKTANGDIEWMYFHAGATSKTMTIEMNGQFWAMDDIEFITYKPVIPDSFA